MKASLLPLLTLGAVLAGCATAPPGAGAPPGDSYASAGIGREAHFAGFYVVPQKAVDSRCPVGVHCIHRGTVALSVRIVRGNERGYKDLTLGKPVPMSNGGWLTLIGVCPYRKAEGVPEDQYIYTFLFHMHGPGRPAELPCDR